MTLRYKLSQGQRFQFKYLLDLTFLSASILVSSLKSFSQKFLTFSSRHNFKPFPNVTLGEKKDQGQTFYNIIFKYIIILLCFTFEVLPLKYNQEMTENVFFSNMTLKQIKRSKSIFFIGCSVVLYHISIVKHQSLYKERLSCYRLNIFFSLNA